MRPNFGAAPRIEPIPPAVESVFLPVVEARGLALRPVAAFVFWLALLLVVLDPAVLAVAFPRVAGLVVDARPVRAVRPRAALEAALEVKGNPVV